MNFLDETDARFVEFRKTPDSKMKDLTEKGVGVSRKQAEPIGPKEKPFFGKKACLDLANLLHYLTQCFSTIANFLL